jgi:tRNA pseudouridine38-40 synthase
VKPTIAGDPQLMGGNDLNIDIMNRPLLRAFRATVAYDGTSYSGCQLQKYDKSVLSEINTALSKILAHPVRAKAASRTDARVHATGQVISFLTSAPRTADEIRRGMNSLLPGDIRITDCRETDFDFNPRHSAIGKVYLYKILRARELQPTQRRYVLFIEEHKPFDIGFLRSLAKELEGEHDYRSFSPRLEPGENPVKTIWKVSVGGDKTLTEIRFIGSGFLYQMIRRMVGLMIAVVQGREPRDAVRKALKNPVKGSVVYNAQPQGLYLEKVMYSKSEFEEMIGEVGS